MRANPDTGALDATPLVLTASSLPRASLGWRCKRDTMLRSTPSPTRPGAERRRDRRYQVDLPARVALDGSDGIVAAVLVSDLSASGALLTEVAGAVAFGKGAQLTLELQDFGAIEAKVVHVGQGFYGLTFINPHLHRDRLSSWLREEIVPA